VTHSTVKEQYTCDTPNRQTQQSKSNTPPQLAVLRKKFAVPRVPRTPPTHWSSQPAPSKLQTQRHARYAHEHTHKRSHKQRTERRWSRDGAGDRHRTACHRHRHRHRHRLSKSQWASTVTITVTLKDDYRKARVSWLLRMSAPERVVQEAGMRG
jgi:hypothetical protein